MSSRTIDFPEHNPFITGYGYDRFLFMQIALAIILLAISGVAGFSEKIGSKRMNIYSVMTPIGLVFVVGVQIFYYIAVSKKQPVVVKRTFKRKFMKTLVDIFIYKNAIGWIVIIINLVIMALATVLMLTRGFEAYQVIDEIFTATWEQLTFAVILMALAVQFFRTGWLSKHFSRRFVSFVCSLIISDLVFALMHWWAYGGDLSTIALIAAAGLVFMGVGYRYPSLGISLHYGYNVMVVLRK